MVFTRILNQEIMYNLSIGIYPKKMGIVNDELNIIGHYYNGNTTLHGLFKFNIEPHWLL